MLCLLCSSNIIRAFSKFHYFTCQEPTLPDYIFGRICCISNSTCSRVWLLVEEVLHTAPGCGALKSLSLANKVMPSLPWPQVRGRLSLPIYISVESSWHNRRRNKEESTLLHFFLSNIKMSVGASMLGFSTVTCITRSFELWQFSLLVSFLTSPSSNETI